LTGNLIKKSFTYKESQCKIISDQQNAIDIAEESIKHHYRELENYIKTNPKFQYALKPLPLPDGPLVAKLMAQAAQKADVGPMAAVAGVIADLAVQDMISAGCGVAVVEDGGEISAQSNIAVDVAVAMGAEPLSRRFGFRLKEFPFGLATSSGRFSHALSFGDAEAAIIFCKDAGLADAAATAVCNVVKGEDVAAAIKTGIDRALAIKGVEGVMIIYQGQVGTAGKIPQIIKIEP
jgi:ApbE superfamily uncharacterized protein (UPF0280 family)